MASLWRSIRNLFARDGDTIEPDSGLASAAKTAASFPSTSIPSEEQAKALEEWYKLSQSMREYLVANPSKLKTHAGGIHEGLADDQDVTTKYAGSGADETSKLDHANLPSTSHESRQRHFCFKTKMASSTPEHKAAFEGRKSQIVDTLIDALDREEAVKVLSKNFEDSDRLSAVDAENNALDRIVQRDETRLKEDEKHLHRALQCAATVESGAVQCSECRDADDRLNVTLVNAEIKLLGRIVGIRKDLLANTRKWAKIRREMRHL